MDFNPAEYLTELRDKATTALVPVNALQFLKTVQGDKSDITEKDFWDSDKDAIRGAVHRKIEETGKTEGYIGYGDYNPEHRWSDFGFGNENPVSMILQSFADSTYRMETALGMAHYKVDDNGDILISDRYDFGASKEAVDKVIQEKGYGAYFEAFKEQGFSGLLSAIGNTVAPEDTGRKVRLNLGKYDSTPLSKKSSASNESDKENSSSE